MENFSAGPWHGTLVYNSGPAIIIGSPVLGRPGDPRLWFPTAAQRGQSRTSGKLRPMGQEPGDQRAGLLLLPRDSRLAQGFVAVLVCVSVCLSP